MRKNEYKCLDDFINEYNGKHEIDVASTDFKLNVEEDHVTAFIDEIKLEAESSKTFALNLTLK